MRRPFNGPFQLQGYLTFENYQSAIGAGEAVVKGINKRIEAGKTIVLGPHPARS